MFILGTPYLSLGVLRGVFGVRYAVSVLVNSDDNDNDDNDMLTQISRSAQAVCAALKQTLGK